MRFLIILGISALSVAAAAPARAATCGEVPRALIVLDRSGSMTEEVSGKKKWATAGTAVNALVGQFTGQLALGVMLFPRWPDVDGCTSGPRQHVGA